MTWYLAAALFAADPAMPLAAATPAVGTVDPAPVEYDSLDVAASALGRELETGSLLFNRGDCLAIRMYTRSPYTHVAAVVKEQDAAIVYDSMNGVGVRKQTLRDYLASCKPDVVYVVYIVNPVGDFSAEQGRAYRAALEQELGRPYAVAHHLTGGRAEGVHCSEYVTDALEACHVIHAEKPSRVSPASLAEGVLESDLYDPIVTVHLRETFVPEREPRNWCDKLWLDTKTCTRRCCVQMRRWFACR